MRQHPGFYTIYEAAAALGVSDATIRRAIRAGKIPRVRVAAATVHDESVLIPKGSIETDPRFSPPGRVGSYRECEDGSPCVSDALGANLEEWQRLAGALRTQVGARDVLIAELRRLADDRGERIFVLQRDLDRLEELLRVQKEAIGRGAPVDMASVVIGALFGVLAVIGLAFMIL